MKFSDLLGKTLTDVVLNREQDEIRFFTKDEEFLMYHYADCCESVYIEHISGDVKDLIDSPILVALESKSDINDTGYGDRMWTFYKLATVKGWVDIRWNGSSNGCYSISVNFDKIN